MFDLETILKAIKIVGAVTPAAKAIYDGFMSVLGETDQATLKVGYAAARERTDDINDEMRATFGD